MLQGLQSAGFFINKVMFVALSPILPLLPELQSPHYNSLKPSLLSSNLVNKAPYIKFYIDNIFFFKQGKPLGNIQTFARLFTLTNQIVYT